MQSLIPGYEYDIFISYRQKDNKYDGWVTEFVDNLKKELEATFKEQVSVYFDINPSDYLLESYDVDASLKDKLKCLVFIPIISRTYCDSKSFAWVHEFKPFVDQASQDKFGLKVKLPGGNVASRVLPIQIHEIAAEDKAHIEKELGGILRPIEFIYKEPGVNRPLRGNEDHPDNNLNKTFYRNQINKVANAIDEIINSMKNFQTEPLKDKPHHMEPLEEVRKEDKKEIHEKPAKTLKRRLLFGIGILAVLIVASILAYPKIFKRDTLERLRSSGEKISLVVLPFQNMTNDTMWNVWQNGIQENLISYLSNSEELQTFQSESVNSIIQSKNLTNYASLTPSVANAISLKLDANVCIYGNIQKDGAIVRVNAKLIDSQTKEIIKSFQIEGPSGEGTIFHFSDSLSIIVRDFLIISYLKKENIEFQDLTSTHSPEAYRCYILGKGTYYRKDYDAALIELNKALAIDSNFTWAMRFIVSSYNQLGNYVKAKEWCLKWYEKIDRMPPKEKLWASYEYTRYFSPSEAVKYLRQLQEIDVQNPPVYFSLGSNYSRLQQYNNAIPEYEKALEIYNKWSSKPMWIYNYSLLGESYHKTGQYKKEKELYQRADRDFPDDPEIIYQQVILSLTEGDTVEAKRYIEKFISIRKENSASEANIAANLAYIYNKAGILDKAEEYYRQAYALSPPGMFGALRTLAFFLIDKDRNVDEGLKLVEKYITLNSENYLILDVKGWGLYKKGKYKEAQDVLQKSWDLRLKNATYYHEAFLHLEAAKKAVANQKNN